MSSTLTEEKKQHTVTIHRKRSLLCNRYDKVREIQRGGAGVVYKAYDTKTKQNVAIKALLPQNTVEAGESQEDDSQLGIAPSDLADIWIMNSFDHPNLVSAIETSLDCNKSNPAADAILRIVMPFAIDSVHNYLSKLDTLPGQTRIQLAHDLLCGLAELHGNNIAHGDLKSHNALLFYSAEDEKSLVGKWTDFGSVIPVRRGSQPEIQSTPLYTAPELVCNKKRVGMELIGLAKSADAWSMGLVLLEILMAQPLETILKQRCPPAPTDEWLAPVICLIGEPSTKWLQKYDRKIESKSGTGPCYEESIRRRKRTATITSARENPVSSASLLDRLAWSNQSTLTEQQYNYFVTLIRRLLQWDPLERITIQQALLETEKDGGNLFSKSHLVCVLNLDHDHWNNKKAQERKPIRGLPSKTQPVTIQMANVILYRANQQLLKMGEHFQIRPGQSDYEWAAVLIAGKYLYDPIVQNLLFTADGLGLRRSDILSAERRLFALLYRS